MIHPEYLQTVFLLEAGDATDWQCPFAIVTTWNPNGVITPAAENEALDLRLVDELDASAEVSSHTIIWGCSRDFHHREASHAIWGLSLEKAIEIGRAYQQEAIFWVSKEGIRVHSCTCEAVEALEDFLVFDSPDHRGALED